MDLSSLQNAPPTHDCLVVAVSGGPDSVALLRLLMTSGYHELIVAHVNHGLRPESTEEAYFVQDMAQELGFECRTRQLDLSQIEDNLEASARTARYEFFRELASEYQASVIVTAHHADDQVETVLMNMIRGCGLDGLAGMRPLDGDLWRPLLGSSKEELLDLCEQHGWEYRVDSSNDDTQLRRNALRHHVIPYLKQLNPSLLETMKDNIALWQQSSDELRSRAAEYLRSQEPRRCDLKGFLALSELEQQVVLRELFQQVHGHKNNLTQDHLQQALKVLRTNVSGKQKEFGPGKVLLRQREWFEVRDTDQ